MAVGVTPEAAKDDGVRARFAVARELVALERRQVLSQPLADEQGDGLEAALATVAQRHGGGRKHLLRLDLEAELPQMLEDLPPAARRCVRHESHRAQAAKLHQ